MGDDKKPKRGKKKLEIKKEAIQELDDGQLDQVAGGATSNCATGEGVQRGQGPAGPTGAQGVGTSTCGDTVR